MLLLAIALIVMAGVLVWLWRPVKPTQTLTQTVPPPVSCGVPASSAIKAKAVIHIPDNERITTQVAAGQTVQWVNDSSETVAMRSVAVANDKECGGIGQPTLKPGDTWQLTFLRTGTWHFAVRGVGVGVVEVK